MGDSPDLGNSVILICFINILHTGLPPQTQMATAAWPSPAHSCKECWPRKSTLLPYKASLELHTFTSYRLGLSHMIVCSRPPKPLVCHILSGVTRGSLFPIGLLVCNRSNAIWLPSHCPRNTALRMFSNCFMLLSARDTSLSLSYLSPEQHLTQFLSVGHRYVDSFVLLWTPACLSMFFPASYPVSLHGFSLNLLFCIRLSSL